MLILAEILLLLYLGIVIWRIVRKSFRFNVLSVFAMLISLGAALLADASLGWFIERFTDDTLIQLVALIPCSVAVYFAVLHIIMKLLRRREKAINSWLVGDKRAFRYIGKSLNLLLVAVIATGVAALLDLAIALASMTPMASDIRDHTIYLKYFYPTELVNQDSLQVETGAETAQPDQSLEDIMTMQAQSMGAFHRGFRSAMDSLSTSLGTKAAVEDVQALVDIMDLPPDDAEWLIENTPELNALQDNEAIRDIMEEDDVLNLVVAVGEGSIEALHSLSRHPSIQTLMNDKEVLESIRSIDLETLQQKVDAHRLASGDVMLIAWASSSVAMPTDIDSTIKDGSKWTTHTKTQQAVAWPAGTRIGLLRAGLSAIEPERVTLCVETPGTVTLQMNRTSLQMKTANKRKECLVPLAKGETELLLIIDFRATTDTKQCKAFLLR